ncbi:YdeI/OmpD-associated family protein [uncultured Marixanthomonas sp.]|uniref:YdeI/OmpD-associated family protein n=1 Tax=uncultured Marixanthomonas sp. TaxID=757245 RepID=UPI0030D8C489
MSKKPELYFPRDVEWREWLKENHQNHSQGVYLIFHKVDADIPSMRWEEAVKVALCYGWIDSTVKSLGNGKRRQYFCPRNPKSTWSALNKKYISELENEGLIHQSGWDSIKIAKENGKWTEMDDVENLLVPEDLQRSFNKNPNAFENYQNFAPSYRKSYLSWLHSAKRDTTREKRIKEIITLCKNNLKSR